MYRIIGVFQDDDEENHVKLIKYTQLPSEYAWNSSAADVNWSSSELYNGINGSYFLTNATYGYMQNIVWKSIIQDWTWKAMNTLSWNAPGVNYGTHYYYSIPKAIYQNEILKAASSNIKCSNSSNTQSTSTCAIGEWTTPTAKIGLMYASDYALSLGTTALAMTTGTYTNRATLKTSWLHQSNNNVTTSEYEWTMARFGAYVSDYAAWFIHAEGNINATTLTDTVAVRPVFYLTADIILSGGEGTLDSPYILDI